MKESKQWARAQGKRLKTYLQSIGLDLTHKQALEAVAQMNGARNWQTFEASADADILVHEPAALRPLAEAALQAALFTALPAGQSLATLSRALSTATKAREAGEEWQAGKARMNQLWQDVKERDFCIPPAQLPPVLEAALQDMIRAMEQTLAVRSEASGPAEVYRQFLWDWRKGQQVDLPVADARTYVLRAQADDAVYVDVTYPHASADELGTDSPQLSVNFEINEGLPCIHIYSDVYGGEALVSLFAARHGELLVRFDAQTHSTSGHPLSDKLSLKHAHASVVLQAAR